MSRLCVALALCLASAALSQDTTTARTYLVKLGVSVSTKENKVGDPIKAAIVSPEILLNGYMEGKVEELTREPGGKLVLRFTAIQYKGKSTPIRSQVVDFVNSKGHKSVDDDERPAKLENGALATQGSDLWLDEGAELRVQASGR